MGNQPPTETPAKSHSSVPWLRTLFVAVLMVSSVMVASPADAYSAVENLFLLHGRGRSQ